MGRGQRRFNELKVVVINLRVATQIKVCIAAIMKRKSDSVKSMGRGTPNNYSRQPPNIMQIKPNPLLFNYRCSLHLG